MIALYNFIPLYCPSCGTPTRLDRVDNPYSGKFKAHEALICSICGIMYQFAGKTELLRVATASGGDLKDYYVEENDLSKTDNGG